MNDAQSRIAASLAALDVTALEALASKGLVRRAQKDLERGASVAIVPDDRLLSFQVSDFRIDIPETGVTKAHCSCPAPGICQHILASVLWLNGQKSEQSDTPALSLDELLSITPEQLEKWAGKPALRAGLGIALSSSPEIAITERLTVIFAERNLTCIYTGGGLDGWITSGPKPDGRPYVVAALIALQQSHDVPWAGETAAEAQAESAGAPRTREEVLSSATQLLHDTLSQGLAHPSETAVQRFSTLSVSALGVNLPRLALLLRSLSDEIRMLAARDSRSSTARTLNRIAIAGALCRALSIPANASRPDLIGWHRTRYDEVGNLDLIGMGAWPWRTASGYEGLTVLFFDTLSMKWNSWSEARPASQLAGFDPVARFTQPGPWSGSDSPRHLLGKRLRLLNARRNANGRLSSSSQTRALVSGKASVGDIPRTHAIQEIRPSSPVGLTEPNPLDSIILFEPKHWADRTFDPVRQLFTWNLADAAGNKLPLILRFEPLTRRAIEWLESVSLEKLAGSAVLGRIAPEAGQPSLAPFVIQFADGSVRNLLLEGSTETSATPGSQLPHPPPPLPEEGELEFIEDQNAAEPKLILETWDILLAIAESGGVRSASAHLPSLEDLTRRTAAAGMDLLSATLHRVILGNARPNRLLPAAYLCTLFQRQNTN